LNLTEMKLIKLNTQLLDMTKLNYKKPTLIIDSNLKSVQYTNGSATVIRKLDASNDLVLIFTKDVAQNINNTPDFYDARIYANASAIPTKTYFSGGTEFAWNFGDDWISSPYTVKALNNINGDRVANGSAWTGGHHGYNGNADMASGGATSVNISFDVYADGVKLNVNDNIYCNNVKLDWVNEVQAWNTKKADGTGRTVLTEHYIVEFIDDLIYMTCTITSKEDIQITQYYGLQAHLGSFVNGTNTLWFVNGTGTYSVPTAIANGANANAGIGTMCDNTIFKDIANNIQTQLFTKRVGLGLRTNVSGANAPFFFTGSKLYANLVNGTPLTIISGQQVFWEGGFKYFR